MKIVSTITFCFAITFCPFSEGQSNQPARMFDIPMGASLAVSDSDVCWVSTSGKSGSLDIVRVDVNGTQEMFTPAFALDGKLVGIYSKSSGQLWAAYTLPSRITETIFGKFEYGTGLFKEIWRTKETYFHKFAVTARGTIFGIGFLNGIGRNILNSPEGGSITASLIHVADTMSRSTVHLLPVAIPSGSNGLRKLLSALSSAIISARPNGNCFVSFDPGLAKTYGWMDVLTNQGVEYFPDGRVYKQWKLTGGPDFTVVSVFAVGNDQVLAEILQGVDRQRRVRNETVVGTRIDGRFLVLADSSGKLTRIDGVIQPWERSIGWMPDKRQIVTEDLRNHTVIRIRPIP